MIQVSLQKTPYPDFHGAAFSRKIESLKIQQDACGQESFANCGLGGGRQLYPRGVCQAEQDTTKGYWRIRPLLLPPQPLHPRQRHLGLCIRPPQQTQTLGQAL